MAKNPYEMFETDDNLEKSGVWVDFGSFRIKIARCGGSNTQWAKTWEAKTRMYRRGFDNIPEDKARRLLAEALAEAIVLMWEGVTDREGNLMQYSQENCVRLLTDLPNLAVALQAEALKMENFQRSGREEEAKN